MDEWAKEAAIFERHPVGGNERARAVNEDCGVVRSLRLQTNANLTEVVALDEPERLQKLRLVARSASGARQSGGANRNGLADRQAVAGDGFDVDHVASVPTGRDRRLTGELDVRGQRRTEADHVCVLLGTVIPPHHLLTDPTGDGE